MPKLPFKPKARLLILLGDQLIRDSSLAVFELVKNAYDADATKCTVTLSEISTPNLFTTDEPSITIEDDGEGMDYRTVTKTWLEPGTDNRAKQKANDTRSPRFKRLPLGEKGVGRFAVHKLGRKIRVVTRRRGKKEVVIDVDWSLFDSQEYLDDVPVTVTRREPERFKGSSTGTYIHITDLRETDWTRGKVRQLHRAVTSICSPTSAPASFSATLEIEPTSDWLEGLLTPATIIQQAMFIAKGRIEGSSLSYDYRFEPLPSMSQKLEARSHPLTLALRTPKRKGEKPQLLDLSKWAIGPISFEFYIYDREPGVLRLIEDQSGLTKYLDTNGGVRVYRDGVRVYDFGEEGNDWLNLGGRRVNVPARRIGNNQIIGILHLDGEHSSALVEKTNREGFIESTAYAAFQDAILFALSQIETERTADKIRVRKLYARQKTKQPVSDDLEELRARLERSDLAEDLVPVVDRIERQYEAIRETLLTAAGSGLTLSTVIHEVDKVIGELVKVVTSGFSQQRVKILVTHLAEMVDGLSFLMRQSGRKFESATKLIDQALFNTQYRMKAHGIAVTRRADGADVNFKCVRRLVIGTLMNLIDNSIYWLNERAPEHKHIYIGVSHDLGGDPAIVVADNGTGFVDSPEVLLEPFVSRKPDGMGLGLHLANEVASMHKGRLLFPTRSDVGIPKRFDGAIVALQLPESE